MKKMFTVAIAFALSAVIAIPAVSTNAQSKPAYRLDWGKGTHQIDTENNIYTARPGDTLWGISRHFGVDFVKLVKANPQIHDISRIFPGERIFIPTNKSDKGDSGKQKTPGTPGGNGDQNQPPDQNKQKPPTNGLSQFEQQVVNLTNQERTQRGLPALKVSTELANMARVKSEDMRNNNYFDHNSPTYGSPFDMMRQFGISFTSAGENIAAGQRTPQEVVNAWMNSPGHRANILNNSYTSIGVGYAQGGSYGSYWTQEFIGN